MNKFIVVAIGIVAIILVTLLILMNPKPGLYAGLIPDADSYISCGCGCCGFDKPLDEIANIQCLFKLKGESLKDKIDQDKQLSPELCATVGCNFPIKYVYCD